MADGGTCCLVNLTDVVAICAVEDVDTSTGGSCYTITIHPCCLKAVAHVATEVVGAVVRLIGSGAELGALPLFLKGLEPNTEGEVEEEGRGLQIALIALNTRVVLIILIVPTIFHSDKRTEIVGSLIRTVGGPIAMMAKVDTSTECPLMGKLPCGNETASKEDIEMGADELVVNLIGTVVFPVEVANACTKIGGKFPTPATQDRALKGSIEGYAIAKWGVIVYGYEATP